jgi:hypothetical protein
MLVIAFRVPASGQTLGAGVRVSAQAPGELHVPGADAFLAARDMTPGGRAERGALPVRNVTRGPVKVRIRVRRGARDLDRSLHLELRSGSRRLASGTVASLRRWSRPLLVEHAGESTVRVRAWIPAGARNTTGRDVDLQLALDADLVKGSRR